MTTPEDTVSPVGRPVAILGTGSYLPENVVTNRDLEKLVDTSDEWIFARTGMRERRIAGEDEATSDLATKAAERALEQAGVAADKVDCIIVATSTPDMTFPSTACLVQDRIKASHAFCMDVSAACSGFLYALDVGTQFVAGGRSKYVLVIGAEKMSAITDYEDRTTCILFGDGAGAALLGVGENGSGILSTVLGSDGSLGNLLMIPAGGSRKPATIDTVEKRQHYIKMLGREVFKHAVNNMTNAAKEALASSGHAIEEIDCIVPHQANARILHAVGQKLGAADDVVFVNVEKYGNTSAASIIVALDEAIRQGRIEKGDLVLLVTFGGGFTWGATVLQL